MAAASLQARLGNKRAPLPSGPPTGLDVPSALPAAAGTPGPRSFGPAGGDIPCGGGAGRAPARWEGGGRAGAEEEEGGVRGGERRCREGGAGGGQGAGAAAIARGRRRGAGSEGGGGIAEPGPEAAVTVPGRP